MGDVLETFDHTIYGQPKIEYRLRAVARMRTPDGALKTVQGERELTVIPCTERPPPVSMADFPSEFVCSARNVLRTSFLGPQYLMTLSTSEPSPVSMEPGQGRHGTTLCLTVDIQPPPHVEPNNKVYTLPRVLKGLRFEIQLNLRAKTYYAMHPFPTMPCQMMATARGPIRLHDSMSKISEVEITSRSWQHRSLDGVPSYAEAVQTGFFSSGSSQSLSMQRGDQSSTQLPIGPSWLKAWTTSLHVPVEFTKDLLPTFCSAIASRQYSIMARIRVKGATTREFVLETPLQVCRSPCAAALSSSDEGEPLQTETARSTLLQQSEDLLSDDLVRNTKTGGNFPTAVNAVASLFADRSIQPDEELPDYN